MTKQQERTVMVVLAVAGAAHTIYTRQRVANDMLGKTRAEAAHSAMLLWRKAATWCGQQAIRAEARYWNEVNTRG